MSIAPKVGSLAFMRFADRLFCGWQASSFVVLRAFLIVPFLVLSGGAPVSAQNYGPRAFHSSSHVRPAYQARGPRRNIHVARKPHKSFLSGLFGSSGSKRHSGGIKPLFGGLKLSKPGRRNAASLMRRYERKMRAAVRRNHRPVRLAARGPHIVAYANGSRGWSMRGQAQKATGKNDFTPSGGIGQGRYRTMCVRLCDGYYYPISFKTGSRHFRSDEERCNSGCYESPTKLFYYANPGEDIENMRSLDGTRYKDLANAFRYRKEYVANCRCKVEPWSKEARTQHQSWALLEQKRKMSQKEKKLARAGSDIEKGVNHKKQ